MSRQPRPRAGAAVSAGPKTVPGLAGSFEALVRELDSPSAAHAAATTTEEPLSDAELRVLRLLPTDLTYREIAGELYLALNTVRSHAGRVRRKLGASTRDEAVSPRALARFAVTGDTARCGTGATGLEPATSGVTGRRSNQLSYAP
jgi:DNA-binding CsgD family transcriptional regulator